MTFATRFRQHVLMIPAGDDGSDTGGAVDRGDELPEDKKPDTSAADAAAEKLTKEIEGDIDPEDPDGEKAEEEAEKKSKKDTRIPLSRHKEILEKERAQRQELEQKLAQYQRGSEVANLNEAITGLENEVMAMEKEYTKLLADGELDKATATMANIRKLEREMAEAKSDMKIAAAEARNTERARYNITLERIEAAFPTLNPDHADFDEAIMAEVVDLKDAYQLKGLTPTQALQKAVKMIVEPRTTRQEVATTSEPRVADKDKAAERKADAVKKVASAASKTPPSLNQMGKDGDKLGGGAKDPSAVMRMSQKEFAALSDAELAAMRGDEL